jgi:MoaA/NifB/PqqE/SkfB family radical SAM enzyme
MKKSHGLKFIKNYAYNHIFSSVKRPTFAYLTITSLCNSQCKYCGMWKNKKENEPTTEEWKRIITDVAKIGAVTLTFSGGEPFLRSDLFELAFHAKSQGLLTMVVTNLSLFNKDHVEKIAENFDFIGISLDTIHPERYSEIRGKDWLEQIKQNIHVLMNGLSILKAETEVSAVVTMSNRNADEIHELIHMIFDELNMDTITFNLIDPNGSPNAKEFIPTHEQLQYFKQVILDHKSLYPISNSTRYFNQLGHFEYACHPWKCVQIDHKSFLITPCLFLNENKINLREQRLSDVWKSKHIQKMYSKYNNCKTCNLGCVAESAWSMSDINFIMNEGFRGIIIPTIKRIRIRLQNE